MTQDVWINACGANDIDPEDVIRFDHGGTTFAIYRTEDDRYFATDAVCTHEFALLTDGLVMGTIIECPLHNGRFDFTTGEAKSPPVCAALQTYPVKVEDGRVYLRVGS
jgi:3-phenylpropionate/trans-cinnamate dioxygenase ferredoxin subunit